MLILEFDDLQEFHRLVPRHGHESRVVRSFDPTAGFHRGLVLSDLDCLVTGKIPALHLKAVVPLVICVESAYLLVA